MNGPESLYLCRMAKSLFPQMHLDEHTPDAWAFALDVERIEDAKEALRNLARRQTWIDVAAIVTEVKAIRSQRITEYGPIEPPSDLTVAEYQRWLRDERKAIGDGTRKRTPDTDLVPGDVHAVIAGAFQVVPGE